MSLSSGRQSCKLCVECFHNEQTQKISLCTSDALLRLNLANQTRIDETCTHIRILLARLRERKMILEGQKQGLVKSKIYASLLSQTEGQRFVNRLFYGTTDI